MLRYEASIEQQDSDHSNLENADRSFVPQDDKTKKPPEGSSQNS
jgi:hypothetical protein